MYVGGGAFQDGALKINIQHFEICSAALMPFPLDLTSLLFFTSRVAYTQKSDLSLQTETHLCKSASKCGLNEFTKIAFHMTF